MDYSPFIDDNGNRLNLEDIKFEHILKIKDNGIEEGYKVEFKSEWNDTFKKNIYAKLLRHLQMQKVVGF